ncbi:hypothetical protein DKX38_008916 [Salix brachista]|uniref:Uncharacterized protein n=1 Tax=Salix brachista TaxID=2182728 RepID=A0A5N5M988_9ROSI|nr:hypothetical protein DKX38_008916 [Salix brachista]
MATVMIKRLASSPFVLITVLFTLAAFSFSSRFPFKPINTSLQQQGQTLKDMIKFPILTVCFLKFYRFFTAEKLALYNGTDNTLPSFQQLLGAPPPPLHICVSVF